MNTHVHTHTPDICNLCLSRPRVNLAAPHGAQDDGPASNRVLPSKCSEKIVRPKHRLSSICTVIFKKAILQKIDFHSSIQKGWVGVAKYCWGCSKVVHVKQIHCLKAGHTAEQTIRNPYKPLALHYKCNLQCRDGSTSHACGH
eukprot:1148297-Pelagomonas_calceolata.AAC.2